MKSHQRTSLGKVLGLLVTFSFGLLPLLKADVVVLQTGAVITGKVLQQDGEGVLLQMEYGTYRYPLAMIRDVKQETAAVPSAIRSGQSIPDWAQLVTLLANNNWAQGLRQVPAAMIEKGNFKNVPYVSFRSASGLYEMNIYGDLNHPAAVQIGAMNYLHQTAGEKSNCVAFISSVLGNAADQKIIRALNFEQKDVQKNGDLTFETILPGEWGSYGGWWISVYNANELAGAQASSAELLTLTQARVAAAPPVTATNVASQPVATIPPAATIAPPPATTTDSGQITTAGNYSYSYGYGTTYGAWTAEELAAARPVTATYPTATGDKTYATANAGMVYPRTYTRDGGTYGQRRR